jgi:hypothetical protein
MRVLAWLAMAGVVLGGCGGADDPAAVDLVVDEVNYDDLSQALDVALRELDDGSSGSSWITTDDHVAYADAALEFAAARELRPVDPDSVVVYRHPSGRVAVQLLVESGRQPPFEGTSSVTLLFSTEPESQSP